MTRTSELWSYLDRRSRMRASGPEWCAKLFAGGLLLMANMTPALAGSLVIGEGVVVKFGPDAGMTAREGLQTSRHVVMTSLGDDSAAGQTGATTGIPAPGDWRGLKVEDSVSPSALQLDRLVIRYAGSSGAAALQVARNYTLRFLHLTDNLLGLRVVGAAQPVFDATSLTANGVGIETREESRPTLVASELAGNAQFGLLNLSPQTVAIAEGNWWGTATGPTDPDGNPQGTGDSVSAGVDYLPFSQLIPLIDCSIEPADGHYAASLPSVTVVMECRNASEYRLSGSADFSGIPFQPMAPQAEFAIKGAAGDKLVYVEFRADTGNTNVVQLPQPIHYTPGVPVVRIDTPEEGAVVATDTTISAIATDAAGIDHVEFFVDTTSLGVDADAPYQIAWQLGDIENGTHAVRVVATSTSQQIGEATRSVTVQRVVVDAEGPVLSDARFDSIPLANGLVLTSSGTVRFTATDPSGVDSTSVLFDGAPLPGGLMINDEYAVELDLAYVENGNYDLMLQATDMLGNPGTRTFQVIVDVTIPPDAPIVTITAPLEGATISSDTEIVATVTGPDIDHVDFQVDGEVVAIVASPPYKTTWLVGGVVDGSHEIRIVATAGSGSVGHSTRTVEVQHPAGDTEGPSITDVRYEGDAVGSGSVLRASGTLSFSVADLRGVASADALFDGQSIPGGALSGASYTAELDLDGVLDGSHVIALRATDTLANSSERQIAVIVDATPDPDPPVVAITSPAADAQLSADTVIVADVTGTEVERVDFYADSGTSVRWIGVATDAPYEAVWAIQDFANGSYTLKAVAVDATEQTGQAAIPVHLQRTSDDVTGPTITSVLFAGQPLASGGTIAAPGLLTFEVGDASGVASGAVILGGNEVPGGGIHADRYSVFLGFDGMANQQYDITLRAVDAVGNPAEQVLEDVLVNIPPPPPPVILVPASPAQTALPGVAVSGTAQADSQVQLFLNGAATGSPFSVPFNGNFASSVMLPDEGNFNLTATAQNDRGTSLPSTAVSIAYVAPSPSVAFSSPPENAVIDPDAGPVTIAASVIDPVGLDSVSLAIDGQATGAVLTQPPFSWSWDATGSPDEEYELAVTAVNMVGNSTTITRQVTLQRAPQEEPPVQTAYTGRVHSIAPQVSVGDVPVVISGDAVDAETGSLVPNALLKLVLRVNGFERRITVSTGDDGSFVFRFVPQPSDAGTHLVSVIHPDQAVLPDHGQFTIDRLGIQPAQSALTIARTVPSTIRIVATASAGSGATGVYVTARPEDQTSGSLPADITVAAPGPIAIPAGTSVPIDVVFTAAAGADSTGTLILAVLDGSARVRGFVVINYTLKQPRAYLVPQPMSVQTGVARSQQVLETVSIANRGTFPAQDVQIELTNFRDPLGNPGPVPAWIYLASPASVGDLAVGASTEAQLVAAPVDAPDGVYNVDLAVSAQGLSGAVGVSISVTSLEIGGLVFQAQDIYTCIPTCEATPGLAGARIRVQKEENPEIYQVVITNEEGDAEMTGLPVGHYRYIASAPSHATATGRVTVRAGINSEEPIFLDYELVSFEWSVVETTIEDQYDVTLIATYETHVPAPVIVIRPTSINLPDMQANEELTGEITITNHGLLRADGVAWQPAVSDDYYTFEFLGAPPTALDAHQVVTLPYKVTKTTTPLPDTQVAGFAAATTGGLFATVKSGASTTAGACHSYHSRMRLTFEYTCEAGVDRPGSAAAGFNKVWGQCSTGSGGGGSGSGPGAPAGGWGGGSGGGPLGTPMSVGPGCVPICPDCDGGGSGGG